MDKLKENIKKLTSNQLLSMLENHAEYTEEALIIAKEELKIRNITEDYKQKRETKQTLSKDELILITRKLCNREGSEDEIEEWIELIEQNVSHPKVRDLIFINDKDLLPEQIVNIAVNYKKTKQNFNKKKYYVLCMSLFWAIYFLFIFLKEKLYRFLFIGEIGEIELLGILSILSILYSFLIYYYLFTKYKKMIMITSFLFSTWIMYFNYTFHQMQSFLYANRLYILFILLPIISILIDSIFFKKDKKIIKYYIRDYFISFSIGVGYFLVYYLSVVFYLLS